MKTDSRIPTRLVWQLIVVTLVTILAWPSAAPSENTNSEFASHTDLDLYLRDPERARREWLEKYATAGGIHTVVNVGPMIGGRGGYWCRIGFHSDTNVTMYKPLPSQAYNVRLFNPDGKPVRKTREGRRRFGKPLAVDAELLDPGRHVILNILRDERTVIGSFGSGAGLWDFDLLKSFRIKKPGPYRMEVQVRLFIKDTNGVFQPLYLTPVQKVVEIRERDLPPQIPWGTIIVYGGGLSLCVLGVGWLFWRRAKLLQPNAKPKD